MEVNEKISWRRGPLIRSPFCLSRYHFNLSEQDHIKTKTDQILLIDEFVQRSGSHNYQKIQRRDKNRNQWRTVNRTEQNESDKERLLCPKTNNANRNIGVASQQFVVYGVPRELTVSFARKEEATTSNDSSPFSSIPLRTIRVRINASTWNVYTTYTNSYLRFSRNLIDILHEFALPNPRSATSWETPPGRGSRRLQDLGREVYSSGKYIRWISLALPFG